MQVPVAGMVVGSQIGPKALKSPLRAASVGTEKVRVCERLRRDASALTKKNDWLRRSGPPRAPPNWSWRSGGGSPSGWK